MTTADAPAPKPARTVLLAAIDSSVGAATVMSMASRLAQGMPGAELHVVHVVEALPVAAATIGGSPLALPSAGVLMERAREHLERYLDAASASGAKLIGHLVVGTPWKEIVQLATDLSADLLVIGTHDYKMLERILLGSVAELIVRKAPCPVVVARPKREAHPEIPEILPPCADCLAVQRETGGKQLWCARHSEKHPHAHVYREVPDSFAMGAQTFRD